MSLSMYDDWHRVTGCSQRTWGALVATTELCPSATYLPSSHMAEELALSCLPTSLLPARQPGGGNEE